MPGRSGREANAPPSTVLSPESLSHEVEKKPTLQVSSLSSSSSDPVEAITPAPQQPQLLPASSSAPVEAITLAPQQPQLLPVSSSDPVEAITPAPQQPQLLPASSSAPVEAITPAPQQPQLLPASSIAVGNGIEYRKGFYPSIRPTQMGLSLNIDMSARAFFESISVAEFVGKHLNIDLTASPLTDQDLIKIKRTLRGVRVQVNYQGHIKRYKISGLSTEPTQQLMFSQDEYGSTISVVQFFRQKYNIALKYPLLPAVQAGSNTKPIYLPMELCTILEGQPYGPYSKKLNERQVTAMARWFEGKDVISDTPNSENIVDDDIGPIDLPDVPNIDANTPNDILLVPRAPSQADISFWKDIANHND